LAEPVLRRNKKGNRSNTSSLHLFTLKFRNPGSDRELLPEPAHRRDGQRPIGWRHQRQRSKLIDKNGGTSGFHSWLGFLPDSKIGAVLLCNTSMPGSLKINQGGSAVDNLGQAILQALANPS
jgi:CubicO group peptidase (beta-lactamase class C family)